MWAIQKGKSEEWGTYKVHMKWPIKKQKDKCFCLLELKSHAYKNFRCVACTQALSIGA